MEIAVEAVTLTDFLRARIAEDEAVAKAAGGEEWYYAEVPGMTMRKHPDDPTTTIIDSPKTLIAHDVVSEAMATHIAAHSPADVLAECEAKRRIVGLYGSNMRAALIERQLQRGDKGPLVAERALRFMALVYVDHPDYREEWRV